MISKADSLKLIVSGLARQAVELTKADVDKLNEFVHRLAQWNSKFNLTAIRQIEDMIPLHLLDSLSVADYLAGNRVIDVGSGGGLPGIPLAIAFPQKTFTLLDSNGKKTRFLEQMRIELELHNVTVVQARVEAYTGEFDHVICRAFTELGNLVDMTKHLLAENGTILAMKGKLGEALPNNDYQMQTLAIGVPGVEGDRHLIIVGKNKHS